MKNVASPVIEVSHVVTRFGSAVVHEDVSLAVYRGEVFAIAGGNGSGKSVLMREIILLQPPTSGVIRLFGQEARAMNDADVSSLRRRCGVLFQHGALFSSLTVAENVAVPLPEHTNLSKNLIQELAILKVAFTGFPMASIKEPYFFSTHPRVAERTASYQRLLDRHYREAGGWLREDAFRIKMSQPVLENALLEISRGRFALAQESIEKCLAREADNRKAHFALAELFRRRGLESDRERSEDEYKIALRLEPRSADAHRDIGLLYYKIGQGDLAREHFRNYLGLSPGAKDRAYIEQYLREIDAGGLYP